MLLVREVHMGIEHIGGLDKAMEVNKENERMAKPKCTHPLCKNDANYYIGDSKDGFCSDHERKYRNDFPRGTFVKIDKDNTTVPQPKDEGV